MARRKRYKLDTWAPQFGCWNETEHGPPPAAASFLGMWISKAGTIRVGLGCCYYDDDGKKVDPDQSKWSSIRYWQLEDDHFAEIPAPQLWCEARFVVPIGKAWAKAHGLDYAD